MLEWLPSVPSPAIKAPKNNAEKEAMCLSAYSARSSTSELFEFQPAICTAEALEQRNLRFPIDHFCGEPELCLCLFEDLFELAGVELLFGLVVDVFELFWASIRMLGLLFGVGDNVESVVGERSGGLTVDGRFGERLQHRERLGVSVFEFLERRSGDRKTSDVGGLFQSCCSTGGR